MITIPEKVKQLLRQDGSSKKLRIHFPNGEREDITNDELNEDSFSFTESICSRDTLKFGLCEASIVEFETIGVGNIKGCEIEVSTEVFWDVDAVSYTTEVPLGNTDQITIEQELTDKHEKITLDIVMWTGNSVCSVVIREEYFANGALQCYERDYGLLVSFSSGNVSIDYECVNPEFYGQRMITVYVTQTQPVKAVTLTAPACVATYTIPYGKFRVDTCPRQSDMSRRKVTAYVKEFTFEKMSSLEFGKRATIKSQHATRKYYDYDLFKFIAINYFNGKENFLKKTLLETRNFGVGGLQNRLNSECYWQVTSKCKTYIIRNEKELKSLYYIDNDYVKRGVVPYIKSELEKIVDKWSENYFSGYYDKRYPINDALQYVYPWISDDGPYGGISINDDRNYIYMYPYGYESDLSLEQTRIFLPYMFTVTLFSNGYEQESYSYNLSDSPELYLVDTSDWKEFIVIEKGDFINKHIDFRKITESYIELMGMFGKVGRNGEFDFISLKQQIGLYPSETLYPADDLYPIATETLLTQSMYKPPAWHEDVYTRLYSKVTCTYKDSETEEDTYAEHIIVEVEDGEEDKYQTYDISDNYLIKENTFTEAEMAEILMTLAANIYRVTYMPADINLRGLPYLEAGDVIQVQTEDETFETIVLRRTLTGIQSLSDNFESNG